MPRRRWLALGLGGTAVAVALRRHLRGAGSGAQLPGGIVMGDAHAYDSMSRLLLGPLFDGIAGDVAAAVPEGSAALEVGCGPGHLAARLAEHGLVVTGVDLDPAMIERARSNAARSSAGSRLSFVAADVANLPFEDASFDVVVSTLSMHHWADARAGLAEVARVLRPGGRALVWDIGSRHVPLHAAAPDPAHLLEGAPLRLVRADPWRWPWRLSFLSRFELARDA